MALFRNLERGIFADREKFWHFRVLPDSLPLESMGQMDYYIENGVRRAIAAREAKVPSILAILHEPGKPPTMILVKLEELHSPKSSVSEKDPRYVRARKGMSSPQTRGKMPPIDVQPLGEAGQKLRVPLAQVVLDPRGASMKPMPEILFRKLCYILHRGFVESRFLARQEKLEQAHDLADAFEIMPGYLTDWHDENLDLIRSHLHAYQDKYEKVSFDYLAVLDMDNQEFTEVLSNW